MGQRSDLDIAEPGLHGPEALLHGDVVHHHHTVGLAKELLGYAAVPVSMTDGLHCTHLLVIHNSSTHNTTTVSDIFKSVTKVFPSVNLCIKYTS